MSEPILPPAARIRNIAELARLAGVHAGTVSRALADNPLVARDTRERIQALAATHGFRPNQMARRLRVQRTGLIGVVVPLGHERRQHLSDPFFMTILGHIADALTEHGYDLLLSRIIPDADDWLERIVDSGMLDGVLLIGQSDQFAAIERVAARYRPMVVWGGHRPGQVHCAVGVDNRLGGRLAGERLIARGCRRLAFFGEVRTLELEERYSGLCDAAASAGLARPLQLDTHLASDVMPAEIAAHLDTVLGSIDGIAAASDVIAMRTVRALADRAIQVPGDIPVTGFDDLPFAEQTVPRLTTVRQDIATGARAMVTALFARIAGEDAPSVEMQPVLVARDTA
ncbi:substrate-binding domain-containing protein [Sphingomonas sp. CFBP 13603]|uniref:LacI family DNA-binding transcriptional regulator n=1 Tax=Sphingomonas sp. CFBP 13603 TaxID=2774040 RepID=UPI001868499C|nr:substrate-binding domain-containing protein [Sphingomonas sp. CFBP 13603]MBE2992852.1 substrate-binding domain-containing protein [Sphingomonas sp. CFBP 13603]